jgi:cupin domain
MARVGDTFRLHDGEAITIRALTPTLLELEAEWAPLAHKPPGHRHPGQDERFEVSAGELTMRMHGREHVLRAGDAIDVPRGAVHAMWNSGSEPARASWQVRPALRTAEFFEYVDALRADGRTGKGGVIDPFAGALALRAFGDEVQLGLPSVVQRPVAALLASVARLRGYPPAPERPWAGGGGRATSSAG